MIVESTVVTLRTEPLLSLRLCFDLVFVESLNFA